MTTISVTIEGAKISMSADMAPPARTEGLTNLEILELVNTRRVEDYLTARVMGILKTHVANLGLELKRQTELLNRKKKLNGATSESPDRPPSA